MDSLNSSRGYVSKYFRIPSLKPQSSSSSPPHRLLRPADVERQDNGIPTPTAASISQLKTIFGLAFGAAVAIFIFLNSTATEVSPGCLYLLIVPVMVAFSASLVGISIPRIARVMESVGVVCMAVTFFVFMSLLLPKGTRWVALGVGVFVLGIWVPLIEIFTMAPVLNWRKRVSI